MCAEWVANVGFSLILNELNKVRTQKGTRVSYEAFAYEALSTTLTSQIVFNPEIHQSEIKSLVWNALRAPTHSGKLEKDTVLALITNNEREYLKKPSRPFLLNTSMSIAGKIPFQHLKVFNEKISFKRPSNLSDRALVDVNAKRDVFGPLPTNYMPVYVKVVGRTEVEAGYKAVDAADSIRGIWNLYINSGKSFRMSFGRRNPVNEVLMGPVHVLHNSDGSFVEPHRWWYEPDYIAPVDLYDTTKISQKLRQQSMTLLSRLKTSALRRDAVEGVLRYTRALDQRNFEKGFLDLWSTLEYLTNTQKESYDTTIRRAAALYKDYDLALEIAKHLRSRRNHAVHSGKSVGNEEALVFQLKNFVEHLLRFYLNNQFRLGSRQEVGEFLDLVKSGSALPRKKHLLAAATRYKS